MTAQYAAGPERFLASTAGPKPSVWRSLLSGFLLLLLIVGVPALLVMTVGLPPLPHDLDVSVLTRAISLETLLALLVWVVWLAWLQFAVCTAVETVSALRGRGMPMHVPLSGGIQGLARRLVITTLLVGAIGAPVAAAAPVAEGPSQAASISQQVDATGAQESAPDAGAAGAAGAGSGTSDGSTQGQENVRYMLGDTELDQETGAQLVGQRVYVVQPPEGRYHDNLWDIAERNLGDGRAYSQIYDLNVGRVQYDGRSLELARLIQPGWLLAMPESATNVDRVVAVPDVNPAPAPPVDQTTDQSGGSMVDDTAGASAGRISWRCWRVVVGSGRVRGPVMTPRSSSAFCGWAPTSTGPGGSTPSCGRCPGCPRFPWPTPWQSTTTPATCDWPAPSTRRPLRGTCRRRG